MEIYVVRHGETGYNKMGLLQGSTNIPLNENGKMQALRTKKALEHISFDIVISSPLLRAFETASIIVPNHIIKIDSRLTERYLGDYEGKPSRIYDQKKYHNYKENCVDQGVEGISNLIKRVHNFMDELREKYPNQTILLVTHGGWINALLYYFKPIPEDGKLEQLKLGNGEVVKYHL